MLLIDATKDDPMVICNCNAETLRKEVYDELHDVEVTPRGVPDSIFFEIYGRVFSIEKFVLILERGVLLYRLRQAD